MNYTEFQREIQAIIRNIMKVDYEVELHKVMKNNDIEMVAITIRRRNTTEAVPTIYLEDFYEMYCVGVGISDIANRIVAIYHQQKDKVSITIDDFVDFENVKDKIMFKLVNYERNVNGLMKTPHKRVLDLAIVFYVLWEDQEENRMTSTIRDSHIELWGIDLDILYRVAYENTISKLAVSISDMRAIACSIYTKMKLESKIDEKYEKDILAQIENLAYPMYVVSNQRKILGAVTMLYEHMLKYFYEKFGGEYFILPSSIHEVIVLPKCDMTVEEMKKMVSDINENEVDYLEVLSDNVYLYNGKEVVLA